MKKIIVIFLIFCLALNTTFSARQNSNILAQALAEDNIEQATALLNVGADFNATYFSRSPIEWAYENNEIEFAIILLNNGADVSKSNLLAKAVYTGIIDFALALLEFDVNLNATYYGKNALEWAEILGEKEISRKISALSN